MIKIIREEKVEVKRVEIELELTYIDGELQTPNKSFTVKDIEDLLVPEVTLDEDEEVGLIEDSYEDVTEANPLSEIVQR